MEMDKIPGVIAVPSQANFIFFTVNAPSVGEVFETLRRNRVLVRLFVGKNGRGGVRVTVGRTAENNEFLQALRAAMGET
jgi:histidinol-phosphate/aromatic aminotransferase/cobyric acid decarboxylase-like protein